LADPSDPPYYIFFFQISDYSRGSDNSHDDVYYYTPPLARVQPRYDARVYLDRPEDAQAIRDAVLPVNVFGPRPTNQLKIEFLQRNSTNRVFNNLDELVDGRFRRRFPHAELTVDHFNYANIVDQAKFFASHHVIIACHGAALANAVFINDETIVLQIHPRRFYYPMYEPLVTDAGGVALSYSTEGDPQSQVVI
jgi:hypothetical protein